MDLEIYDVIKKIIVSNKCDRLRDAFGKITFEVHKAANKIVVKNAVEKIWDVRVKNVRIINVKGKSKAFGRRPFQAPDRKKAIITLKEGYKIDLPQFESMGVSSGVEAKGEAAKARPSVKGK
jgi:large subunit ribosomal protein L23